MVPSACDGAGAREGCWGRSDATLGAFRLDPSERGRQSSRPSGRVPKQHSRAPVRSNALFILLARLELLARLRPGQERQHDQEDESEEQLAGPGEQVQRAAAEK